MKLRAMTTAPKDRRILIWFVGDNKPYCGQWIDEEIAGKGRAFWCTDRVHLVGRRDEQRSTVAGWLPIPDGSCEPATATKDSSPVLIEGACYWVADRDAPGTPSIALYSDRQWWPVRREKPTDPATLVILAGPLESPSDESTQAMPSSTTPDPG